MMFPTLSLLQTLSLLLLGLLVAGLFWFGLRRFSDWRIARKGLLLVAVPFLLVVALLVAATGVKRETEQAQAWQLHSKQVIVQAESVCNSLLNAQASISGYIITAEPRFAAPFDQASQELRHELAGLQQLVQDNPTQHARAARLDALATARLARLTELKRLVAVGARDEAALYIKSGEGKRLMDEFRGELAGFLQAEEQIDEARRQAVAASWREFNLLLVSGALVSVLLTLWLGILFQRGIGRRLSTLTANTQRLVAGQTLAAPLTGADELAQLDRVIHDVARQLLIAQGELEARVSERTHELSAANESLNLLLAERRQAEAEITRLNESLELRVVERTAQLEAANSELEAFSYSVSHDLRAPLRAVDGFSRILLEDHGAQLDADGRRVLDVIRANARQMAQLIDDLLSFSRFSRKPLAQAEVDLTALVGEVRAQLETTDTCAKCAWQIEPLPAACGDRALLTQVFVNLLANAIKYTRHAATPQITVGSFERNGEQVYYVRDNGAGFDMRYAGKLFGVFQRLHSAEEFEGTGVGLAIVKRIVERHGGRVWAEGRVGAGATIFFTLPRAAVSGCSAKQHTAAA